MKTEQKNWCVANYRGELIGHDMTEQEAKRLAAEMQEKEPDQEWEAVTSIDTPVYYKVTTFYFDNGRVAGTIEETSVMESTYGNLATYDKYTDTFEYTEEAQQFLNEALNESNK